MLNKTFISGYISKCKNEQLDKINLKFQGKFFLFDIDTYDVLKHWKGSQEYQKLTCIALQNTMKGIKELVANQHKGIIIIEGHVAKPCENCNDMYIIVDKYIKTTTE